MAFSDNEARDAVRQLMKRFDLINGQRLGLAYVLAERDAGEYEKLRAAAEKAEATVIQPLLHSEHDNVYAALDDPNADWPNAVMKILDTRPIVRINGTGL